MSKTDWTYGDMFKDGENIVMFIVSITKTGYLGFLGITIVTGSYGKRIGRYMRVDRYLYREMARKAIKWP